MDYEQEQKIVSDSKEYVSQNLALSHIDDNELREKIDNIVNQRIGSLYCSLNQRASMVEQVYSSIRGFGCQEIFPDGQIKPQVFLLIFSLHFPVPDSVIVAYVLAPVWSLVRYLPVPAVSEW